MRKIPNQKLNMEPKIILKDLGESKLSMLLVQNWLRIRLKTSVKVLEVYDDLPKAADRLTALIRAS